MKIDVKNLSIRRGVFWVALITLLVFFAYSVQVSIEDRKASNEKSTAMSELMSIGSELLLYYSDNGEENVLPDYNKFFNEISQYRTEYYLLKTYPNEFRLHYKPKMKFSDLSAGDKILSFRSLTLYANGDVK